MRRLLCALSLVVVACDRSSSTKATQEAAAPASATGAIASAAPTAKFSGKLCRDGAFVTTPTAPAAGPRPGDDRGPFFVDGVLESTSDSDPEPGAEAALCATMSAVRTCIETARKAAPSLVGTLDVALEFSKGGGVARVDVDGGSLPETEHPCIVSALRKTTLPAGGSPIGSTVSYRVVVQAAHGRSPVATITEKKLAISGTVSEDSVRARVLDRLPQMRRCYETRLRTEPSTGGTLEVELSFHPLAKHASATGRAKVAPGSLKSAPLLECVERALDGIVIPYGSDAGASTANLTLELSYARP